MSGLLDNLKSKVGGKSEKNPKSNLITTVNKVYEINLVPEVKAQMIKSQRMRNVVLFVCIVVSAISIGAVVVLFGIKSGQDIAMASQDGSLEVMSKKLSDYSELDDLVAIQGQLSGISEVGDGKKVLSRTFAALDVMLPKGGDLVQLSQLNVNAESNLLTMEGLADARTAPLIDYRVLESFKKGVALTKYDYGRYVDVEGNEIPTWCIAETDADGNAFKDGEAYFAWWDLTREGCSATPKGSNAEGGTGLHYGTDAEVQTAEMQAPVDEGAAETPEENQNPTEGDAEQDSSSQTPTGPAVTQVKIWRTPQYDKWHRSGKMELNGEISGIEHFESQCTKYSGVVVGKNESASDKNETVKWSSENDCMLVPEGMDVVSSANARDASDNLVLKFTANLSVANEFYLFKNKFMMAIGPMGQNVTDSYVQIQGMFAQEAVECDKNDAACFNNATNAGGK